MQQNLNPRLGDDMYSSENNDFLTISTRETALYLNSGFKLMHVVGETTI